MSKNSTASIARPKTRLTAWILPTSNITLSNFWPKTIRSKKEIPLPSETALSLRQKYKYIFVDEYQDINYVQKAILDLLSSADNIFVVGDVKQSIYAFRGAEPKIFVENLTAASPDPKKAAKGLRVDLNANFRSDKQILDFVNKIFSKVMTASLGDVDYDDSAKLRPAAAEETKQDPAVEFLILDEQGDEDSQK